LRTDEKHIRAQSTILNKIPVLFLFPSISVQKTRLARAAQFRSWYAAAFAAPRI